MADLWFAVAAATVVLYAVLDGFDLGAGLLLPWLARTPGERAQIHAAIGPWWDANEVWLLAAAGALFTAFPRALAAGLSGFYFAFFLVLWALIGRGFSIEARHRLDQPLWHTFWDAAFAGSSLLLAFLFGVVAGNLVRGVPLDGDGWFALALFTEFRLRPAGLIDAWTLATGLFGVLALAAHGATWLAWRCAGGVETRAAAAARRLRIALAIAWPPMIAAIGLVDRALLRAALTRPASVLALALAAAGLVLALVSPRDPRRAFAGTAAFLAGVLAAIAASLHPVLLRSLDDPARSLTVSNAVAGDGSLRFGLVWWSLALPLVALGFWTIGRHHRERARAGGP